MIKKIISVVLLISLISGNISFAEKSETDIFLSENGYAYPAVFPPLAHPRVFVTKDDIERINLNLSHPQNESVYKYLKEKSTVYANGILASRAVDAKTNMNSSYIGIMEACAFRYLTENNKDMGTKAVTIAKNMLKTLDNAPGTDEATRLGGQCIFSSAIVYDWCYPLLSDTDKMEIIAYMLSHAEKMEVGWPPSGGSDVLGHSAEAQLLKDLLAAGIAVYDENPDIYNMVAARLLSGIIPSREHSYNLYEFSEGTSYGSFRYAFELMCAYLFKGIGFNAFTEKQKNHAYGMLFSRKPDGKYISSGDDVTKYFSRYDDTYCSVYFLAGNLCKEPILKREYYRSLKNGISSSTGIADISPVLHLVLNDVNVSLDKTMRDLPLTFYTGSSLISRTSWQEGADSNSMLVKMNMPEYNYGNHQHMDTGHFDIYYKGNLAIDSGIYESEPFLDESGNPLSKLAYGSSHDMNYHKRTVAHNSMLIYNPSEEVNSVYTSHSDGGQRLIHGSGYEPKTLSDMTAEENKVSEVISCDYGTDTKNPSYSYLRGNLTKAYTDKVENYSRSFLFLNFFDSEYPGALIVLDNITSKVPSFKKSWLLHTEEEPEISENFVSVERNEHDYHGKLVNETLLPKRTDIVKIGGAGQEFVSGGTNFKAVRKSDFHEAGNYRIEISPSDSNKKDVFLNVLTVYDSDKQTAPLLAELVSDTEQFAVVKIKDRVCYIAKEDSLISSDISIDANPGYECIVTGLEAGKWNVINASGKTVKTLNSHSGGNTISFKPGTGTYTLSYAGGEGKAPSFALEDNIITNTSYEADIYINNCYASFENKPQIINGILYLPAEELMEKVSPEFEKVSERGYTNGATFVEFFLINGSFSVNGATAATGNQIYKQDDVLYVPAVDFLKSLGQSVSFNSISNILSVLTSETEGADYSVSVENLKTKFDMQTRKHKISLDIKNSDVKKRDVILLMAGDKPGIINRKLSVNGEELYPYYIGQEKSSNGTAHFEFNVTLPDGEHKTNLYILTHKNEAKLEEIENTSLPSVYDSVYKTNHGHYTFGKVYENPGDKLTEWGMVFSEKNDLPLIGDENSKKLDSKFPLNDKGQFGIFMLFKNISKYNIRAYAVYEDENSKEITVYSQPMCVEGEE